ncbi:hypothetical protein GcM3_210034 [Golovinomyces cichoracearum]|uniref:Uncharacterized protein n=1 Tax=Golovinomyces cichoracearum TaxID=62708 RepID=A0A420HA83_9PEZI|nr:hypothetical protein GcM3_210034 [Golovinomyces cichoracearum]
MSNKSEYLIIESNSKGLKELEMAERKNSFGDVAEVKIPSLSVLPIINVTPFSERDQDAGGWIAALEIKFVQAGFDSAENVPGWMWARRPSEISDLERDIFTDEYVRRFELVVAPESEPQHQKMVNELRQYKDESLRDYSSRVQGNLEIIAVDGSSEYRGVASSVNKFVIEMIADRFVLGIYNEELSARAVDREAAPSKSLHQAFEVIQGCQMTMSDQVRRNEMWQQMHKAKALDLIQENSAEVNAVVNDFAQFNIDSVRAGNFRRLYAVAGVSSALPGRIIPTEAHTTQECHQQFSLPAPSLFQRHKDEQQYSKNSSGYRGPPQRDSWRNRGENYSKYNNHGRNRGEFEGQRHAPASHQRRSVDSTHPFVNGRTGPFHYSSECLGPMLIQWKQDILQSKSRGNIAKPTASQVTGEPSGMHENFERDQTFGRSYSPQFQS